MSLLNARARELAKRVQQNASDSFSKFALALELWKADFPPEKIEALFSSIHQSEPQYHGLYYHYGKWLEEQDRLKEAITMYEEGISVCKSKGEDHALSELLSAKTNAEIDF